MRSGSRSLAATHRRRHRLSVPRGTPERREEKGEKRKEKGGNCVILLFSRSETQHKGKKKRRQDNAHRSPRRIRVRAHRRPWNRLPSPPPGLYHPSQETRRQRVFLTATHSFLCLAVVIAVTVTVKGFGIGQVRRKLFNADFFKKNFPEIDTKAYRGGYPDMGNGRFSDKLSFEDWALCVFPSLLSSLPFPFLCLLSCELTRLHHSFNNYQRCHYNYVEGVSTALTFLVCPLRIITSSHHHINTSSHQHIITSSHHHIITSKTENPQKKKKTISGLFYPQAAAAIGGLYIVGRAVFAIGYRRGGPNGRLPGALALDLALVAWLGLAGYGLFQHFTHRI